MSVRRVTILRPDNLGDVVLFSGALRHLRGLYPDAAITFVGKEAVLPLLRHCPFVDHLLPWEPFAATLPPLRPRPAGEGWWAARRRRATRRRERRRWSRFLGGRATDVLLLPLRSPTWEMHRVVEAFPAREKYGIAGDAANQLPRNDEESEVFYTARLRVPPERRFAHELEVTAEFLAFLGASGPSDDPWPELWTDDADRAWATEAVPLKEGILTIGVAPGRTETRRLYAPERYAEALAAAVPGGASVVVLGAPGEEEIAGRVVRALEQGGFPGAVRDLCGRSTIRQLVEAIRRLDVLVSLDSAALHVAAALRKPVVGVRGGGQRGRFWPWGDPARSRLVAHAMDCYGCDWHCVHERVRCVEDIPLEALRSEIAAAIACAPAPSEA